MSFQRLSARTMILAGGLTMTATGVWAQTSTPMPDAQIEANVLRALAGAPDLSTQNVQTSTVYGTVTLSGNVHDEALRVKAENLAARAVGVKKVVDQLTIGDTPAAQQADGQQGPTEQPDPGQGVQQPVLQSDGTYAPAPDGSGAPPPDVAENGPPPSQQDDQQGPPPPRQPMYSNGAQGEVSGGQRAGMQVTIPPGAILRIRINRGLDSAHTTPGTNFDGTVLTDVIAGGAVAIPRGATVQGTVVDVKKAGTFKGEGEIALKIDSLTLGGAVYPIVTDAWDHTGRDKTAGTVNNTIGLGAVGALIGAAAGGGAGAAIGAGVGAGAGLASSAGGPRGQIAIFPESVLTFRTAAPTTVRTVSEAEMSRLSYAAGPQQRQGPPPQRRYYRPGYGYYYGPAY
jgi:hypothetical protein